MSGLDTQRELIGRHAHNIHGPSAIEGLTVSATEAPHPTALRHRPVVADTRRPRRQAHGVG